MERQPLSDTLKSVMREHFLSELKGHRSLEAYELDLFDWFRKETEDAWARMYTEEQKYIQKQGASGSEEINDSGIIPVSYFRKRMRYSHVIFLASLLEGAMKRECGRLTAALGEKILFNPSDLKGDPWSARKVFLERYGSFKTPDDLWASIKSLLAVRNALIHHNGEISLLTEEQVGVLRKTPHINVENVEIDIEDGYLDQPKEAIRELMEFLHCRVNSVVDSY